MLIQATLEDLQSLYKIPDDIFELRLDLVRELNLVRELELV